MKVEWFKEYSQCLNRDMEFNVYGHAGEPILVFPSQNGRYFDFANNGMVATIEHLIDDGKVQLFCCDSIDQESWSDEGGDNSHRTYMMEQWYYYIVNELVPRIFEINSLGNNGSYASGIFTTGCSMGATHAANFMFRRPDIFKGCIALSGYYDSDLFFSDYHDDILYRNSPIQYINGMSYDHPYVDLYRQCKIVLCTGQGAWEDDMIVSTSRMKELLDYKDVPAWIDFWGYDVNHDWPWWRVQFPYFVERVI
ncbi:MAG: esterase family protein [Coprobacillus sp.]|nr:esterase family protein [Coprobacillus sp.]MCI9093257.1 esterase family protein [Coprobacillus sp.]